MIRLVRLCDWMVGLRVNLENAMVAFTTEIMRDKVNIGCRKAELIVQAIQSNTFITLLVAIIQRQS